MIPYSPSLEKMDRLVLEADKWQKKQEVKEELLEEQKIRLAEKYGVPVDEIDSFHPDNFTLRNVEANGTIDTSIPLAGGYLRLIVERVGDYLLKRGVYRRDGKVIQTLQPDKLERRLRDV